MVFKKKENKEKEEKPEVWFKVYNEDGKASFLKEGSFNMKDYEETSPEEGYRVFKKSLPDFKPEPTAKNETSETKQPEASLPADPQYVMALLMENLTVAIQRMSRTLEDIERNLRR